MFEMIEPHKKKDVTMHLITEKSSLEKVSDRVLELVCCCGECSVQELCELTHFNTPDVEDALRKLQWNGYLERSGQRIHLKEND